VPPELLQANVRAVVLTDAQVEHAGGLLGLRSGAPIDLYATPAVFEALTDTLPVLPVLQHYCGVHWRVVPVAGDQGIARFEVQGLPTLAFTALATRAPQPPHVAPQRHPAVGDSIALLVEDRATGQRLFCASGALRLSEAELSAMRGADCLLLDAEATLQARGADGRRQPCAELLPELPARHKVLLGHAPAEQRAHAQARGVVLAYDGLAIEL
jgi:pyrroloquinoline quinone biosynthesis protein B